VSLTEWMRLRLNARAIANARARHAGHRIFLAEWPRSAARTGQPNDEGPLDRRTEYLVQDRLDTKRMQSKCAPVSLVFGAGDLFGFYSQLTPASGSTRWRIAPRQIRTTSSLRGAETALAGWGARIRTWEWRNQNPTLFVVVQWVRKF
jgi:hypothetical protein